jgi:hypothetical protein
MFHVPELARDTTHPLLGTTAADGNNGAFHLDSPEPGWRLALICSDGTDDDPSATSEMKAWEHVSVHAYRVGTVERHVHHSFLEGSKPYTTGRPAQMRTPTWKEMVYVKDLCWDGEDVVMQLHPRKSEYVNCHKHVLHLWRPRHRDIPTPPAILVGPLQGATT